MKPLSSTAFGTIVTRAGSIGGRLARCASTARGERVAELGQPLAGRGADRVDVEAALLQGGAHQVDELPRVRDVDLVEDGDPQPADQVELLAAVLGELVLERLDVGLGVAAGLHRRHVDDVHQDGAALDVAEELHAQALAGGGAGDQAGHVGHRVDGVAGADHAEVGHQRGERVVGDLRAGRRHRRDQRRLARRREARRGRRRRCS